MLLSDSTIVNLLEGGELSIVPMPEDKQIQPVSVDLHLGDSFCRLREPEDTPMRLVTDRLILRPGDFVLAATAERVSLPPHIAGNVCGKSSVARDGVMVEAAGLVDPGFNGTLTLEIKNLGHLPRLLTAGMLICQISFQATDRRVVRPYGTRGLGSHYQGQTEAEPSRV